MATRGTYSIQSRNDNWVTYYIHWDNYLSGAALYFKAMLDAKSKRDCLATRFVIGNPLEVEITLAHEQHGDTEYRYDLDNSGILTAYELIWNDESWKIVFQGNIEDFVEQFFTAH